MCITICKFETLFRILSRDFKFNLMQVLQNNRVNYACQNFTPFKGV